MASLIILGVVFLSFLAGTRILCGQYHFPLSGRAALSAMLIFIAGGHFLYTQGMTMMLPESLPFRTAVIYLTGIIEITAAFGLLISSVRKISAKLLIVFLILILPANIYAAIRQVDYRTATYQGPGITYLWFRIPMQILLIVWTYITCLRR